MKVELLEKYIDRLLTESAPDKPVWNIEHILNGSKPKWNYIDGCMIKALIELYYITDEKKYINFADEFIDYYVSQNGDIKSYSVEEYNLDNINEGKVLFDLFDLTGKKKYKKAADLIYSQLKGQPRTEEGNFWHKKIYPNQVWLDGLYMAQPFYLEWEKRYNNYKNIEDVLQQFTVVEEKMKDKTTELYYHAYDSSREMFWCDKETGLSENYWLRAIGWFIMALVDSLEILGDDYKNEKQVLVRMLNNLSESLSKVQDECGMWYQLVGLPKEEGNYLETSGSAIIAYAYLKASRLGLIDEKFRELGRKAFFAINNKYLEEKNGIMSLGGICLVAGLGGAAMRDGTVEYYLSEPVVKDEAKGVAPLLLAYTEILRIDD